MRLELDELEREVGHVSAFFRAVQAVSREIREDVGRTNSDLHLLVSVSNLLQGCRLGLLLNFASRPMRKHLFLGLRVLVYHIRNKMHIVPQQKQQELFPSLEGRELFIDEPSVEVLMTEVIDHSEFF